MADARRAAIERLRKLAEADPDVVCAFLGGSFAAGTADEFSDLDVYLVTEERDYAAFFARREQFVRAWGDVAFVDTTENFEGFGFDIVHFVFRDGVCGELALGHRENLLALHGGPHEALVDKAAVLAGVTFPAYEPSEDDRTAALERALAWFWLDVIGLAKALARHRVVDAQQRLTAMRDRCRTVVGATGADAAADARLLATYVGADSGAIADAATRLIAVHRGDGAPAATQYGLAYPEALAAVAEAHLRRAADG